MVKGTKGKPQSMMQFLDTLKRATPKVGDVVTGKIIAKEPRRVFVNLGAIGTGIIYGAEYIASREEIKNLPIGGEAHVKILSLTNEDGFFEVSLREAGKEEAWQNLKKYRDERTTLPLQVLDANRGGLILESEGITGFLPVSQLALGHYPRVEGGEKNKIYGELKKFVGQILNVRIIDAAPKEEKLIFSEKEAEEDALKALIAHYHVGDTVEGTITAVVNFGAFMRFGDPPLEGLVHISEIDYKLIDNPNKFLKVGEVAKAKIIAIENNRISLSLKALKEDPWTKVEEKYKKGEMYEGKVLKINPFGAFIELDPDIHGLCHVAQFNNLTTLKGTLEVGAVYRFKILAVDSKERRMSLELVVPEKEPSGEKEGESTEGLEGSPT